MKHTHFLVARLASIVSVLTFVLLTTTPSFAGSTTPNNPQVLDVSTPSMSGTLVGSPGGAYNYYQVSYQGGYAPVLFTLSYSPFYGSGSQTFGFNLYGPNNLSFSSTVTGTSGNTATGQYTLVNPAAMTILVQVYNYTNGGSINYTLTVSGLSGGSSTAISGTSSVTPEQAAPVTTTNATLGGTIVGSAAGTFNYYTLHYPGGNSPMSITMNENPPYSGTGTGVGFNLYRPVPTGSLYVLTSTLASESTTGAAFSATVTAPSAGDYQLQVFNYWPGMSINYGIVATGLAGPTIAASGNESSDHAIVLNSARQGATGTIVGTRGGSFNYYLVNYPGNNSPFDISVTYNGTITSTPSAWGFKVYEGSTLEATVPAVNDGNGVFSAIWQLQSQNFTPQQVASPQTFGVQVFNYDPTTPANYVIYEVGSL